MKILVFDTQTTGLPIGRNPSFYKSELWPKIVQLSWILFDTYTNECKINDHIIKVDDIPEDSYKIHGITTRYSQLRGENLIDVMDIFDADVNECDIILGHNVQFDKKIYIVECIRNNRMAPFTVNGVSRPEYCTMKKSIKFCNITAVNKDGKKYLKYPKLSELYEKIFGSYPKSMHNATVDCLACLRCYGLLQYNIDFVKINSTFANLYTLIS